MSLDYDTLRYRLVPPAFLVFFTVLVQILVLIGYPQSQASLFNVGSVFAWKAVAVAYLWAFVSLKVR